MMHYRKGENIEQEIKKEDLPFQDCLPKGQEDFLWMRVKGGTKVHNVVTFAKNALDKGEYRTIVWTGAGGGVVKTVSCAEIIKRTHPLYQVTRMCYTEIEEHWIPQMEGLDAIVAKRQIPCLHILMTLDAIDDSVEDVQKPNTKTDFFNQSQPSTSSNRPGHGSRGQQRRHQNQTQGVSGAQRSREKPKQQTPVQLKQQEKPENESTEQRTPNTGENSGAKRKQNNRKRRPKDNTNTSQTASNQQKSHTTQGQTEDQPMET